MINWISTNDEIPDSGKRIVIRLPDGRVCSAMVTETGGLHLEYVDSIDLLIFLSAVDMKWIYPDDQKG